MSEVKFADLKKAAKELNIVLKPVDDIGKPKPIKLVGVTAEYLIKEIKDGAALLDPAEGDVIHRDTADTIKALGIALPYNGTIPAVSADRLLTEGEEVYLTIDGQRGELMKKDDTVEVCHSGFKLQLVSSPQRNYFDLLKEKLRWG